ncbi:hypothetical protein AAFF_G00034420 [Aldrovandia affinis]|uniref:Uncharacterized protein n=1 Tax=Aldrovandia affinis TaxID=143900 RepID=A0AAD7S3I8_9TELE|nr:hypothetical protein AAFF_G00034420 [Aldrovandia affinis]
METLCPVELGYADWPQVSTTFLRKLLLQKTWIWRASRQSCCNYLLFQGAGKVQLHSLAGFALRAPQEQRVPLPSIHNLTGHSRFTGSCSDSSVMEPAVCSLLHWLALARERKKATLGVLKNYLASSA